jgi:hypothetical protein
MPPEVFPFSTPARCERSLTAVGAIRSDPLVPLHPFHPLSVGPALSGPASTRTVDYWLSENLVKAISFVPSRTQNTALAATIQRAQSISPSGTVPNARCIAGT